MSVAALSGRRVSVCIRKYLLPSVLPRENKQREELRVYTAESFLIVKKSGLSTDTENLIVANRFAGRSFGLEQTTGMALSTVPRDKRSQEGLSS